MAITLASGAALITVDQRTKTCAQGGLAAFTRALDFPVEGRRVQTPAVVQRSAAASGPRA